MNYVFLPKNGIAKTCAKYLIEEIKRFDVRAKVELANSWEDINKSSGIILIIIGSGPFIRKIRKKFGVPNIFFAFWLPSEAEMLPPLSLTWRSFRQAYVTLPGLKDVEKPKSTNVKYVGNPLIDIIRKHDFADPETIGLTPPFVAVLLTNVKSLSRQTRKLRQILEQDTETNFVVSIEEESEQLNRAFAKVANVNIVVGRKFEVIKESSAALTIGSLQTLDVALLNCPQIMVVVGNPITQFFNRKPRATINKLFNRTVIQELRHPLEIINELNKILNDHQYSAGILNDYQLLREQIGTEPCFRKTARLIIDALEN